MSIKETTRHLCLDYPCFMNRLEYTRQDTSEKLETVADLPSPQLQVKLLHQMHQTTGVLGKRNQNSPFRSYTRPSGYHFWVQMLYY